MFLDNLTIHNFDINEERMITIQNNLRKEIHIDPSTKQPQFISGVDVVYSDQLSLAVIITFDYNTKKIVECTYAITKNYLIIKQDY